MARVQMIDARREFQKRMALGMVVRPLRMFCTECGKYIPSDLEWKCGFCNFKNYRVRLNSFLRKCQGCKRAPHAIVCPHCQELNFLMKYAIGDHPARVVEGFILPVDPDLLRMQRKNEREFAKSEALHEKEMAEIHRDTTRIKNSPELRPKKSRQEEIEEDLLESEAAVFGHEAAAEKRALYYKEQFPKNSQSRRRAMDFLKKWRRKHIS